MWLNDLYHSLSPIAFSIGPLSIRWYGLAYLAGFICAGIAMVKVARRWELDLTVDDIVSVVIGVAFGVIVGARLFYVVFYGAGYYLEHPLEIIALNQGGMSFHGGLVGAVVGGSLVCRQYRISIPTVCDLGVIGAPLGLFFGRCANFVNGELWGAPTDLPWGVVFGGSAGTVMRHPSQLYEALLEGVLLFIILFAMSRKRPPFPRGTYFGVFMVGYGICRFAIEFVRQPDAQLGYLWGGWLTMGQVLSVPLVVAGVCLLVYAAKRKLPQEGPRAVAESAGGEE